ncbi:hypothetical protein BOTBODRAFT_145285 [Botryobasidium botryosum FD-172 SS1]|uniref:Uncharacterized protein n=1 Tax=Botryobasidium botryosum (strain FD-172 SS1) TaxID=930990 RepID=A0A067MKQ2_BOTB1|nr:hypothetical protein BOTBODRAFT_145285 [Botryobasidium botryosum FD-172 SS1]
MNWYHRDIFSSTWRATTRRRTHNAGTSSSASGSGVSCRNNFLSPSFFQHLRINFQDKYSGVDVFQADKQRGLENGVEIAMVCWAGSPLHSSPLAAHRGFVKKRLQVQSRMIKLKHASSMEDAGRAAQDTRIWFSSSLERVSQSEKRERFKKGAREPMEEAVAPCTLITRPAALDLSVTVGWLGVRSYHSVGQVTNQRTYSRINDSKWSNLERAGGQFAVPPITECEDESVAAATVMFQDVPFIQRYERQEIKVAPSAKTTQVRRIQGIIHHTGSPVTGGSPRDGGYGYRFRVLRERGEILITTLTTSLPFRASCDSGAVGKTRDASRRSANRDKQHVHNRIASGASNEEGSSGATGGSTATEYMARARMGDAKSDKDASEMTARGSEMAAKRTVKFSPGRGKSWWNANADACVPQFRN